LAKTAINYNSIIVGNSKIVGLNINGVNIYTHNTRAHACGVRFG